MILALLPATFAAASEGDCSPFQLATGSCVTPNIGTDDVTLGIDVTQPGTPAGPWLGDTDGGTDGDAEPAPVDCATPASNNSCPGFRDPFTITMVPPPAQPITLADVASFRPTTGVSGMEPNGWMIVGLHTNFFSTASADIVDGTLLGLPASVRFTPVAWRWSYGDGTAATLSTPGSSWAALGVAEFSPTSGSHIFRSAGTYVIDLSVVYAVEYRFGSAGWTRIDGTLALPSNRLTATAGSATTVLVERECTVNPRGPGC